MSFVLNGTRISGGTFNVSGNMSLVNNSNSVFVAAPAGQQSMEGAQVAFEAIWSVIMPGIR